MVTSWSVCFQAFRLELKLKLKLKIKSALELVAMLTKCVTNGKEFSIYRLLCPYFQTLSVR